MYSVYVLKSRGQNYIYVGLTSNVSKRVIQHNSGKGSTTRAYAPFDLVHTERFELRSEARLKEKYFKTGAGKEYIKRVILKNYAQVVKLADTLA